MDWKNEEKNIIIHDEKMNVIESCLDRHAQDNPDKLALFFHDENKIIKLTYKQLQVEVNKFANLLNNITKQNSHVFIFLPKCPELYISFLATIKQGSIVAPLFEAFQQDGLELRLQRGDAKVLVTNQELLKRLDKKKFPDLKIIVIDDKEHKEKIKKQSQEFETVLKNKQDTAMMIFTSSTAGTPVAGIMLPHYGLVQQDYTARIVLELTDKDNYWCTAHPAWITGAVYGVLAPLSIGCSIYVLEQHFDVDKWLKFLDENKITVMYTAPTVLRMFKEKITKTHLKNLKNICSVGEALHKETFDFYHSLGTRINDTYWQTEIGSIVIANYNGNKKPGSLGKPIGINAKIEKNEIVIETPWPSMMTSIYKHPDMYKSYFHGKYFLCHDQAEIDKDGFFFFEGRKDDIIKTRGERVSPLEIESALMKHKDVKEAAVIGVPDPVLGEKIKAFIVLKCQEPCTKKDVVLEHCQKSKKGKSGFLKAKIQESEELKQEIMQFVKQHYAGHAYPKEIQFIKALPKTNSSKIIRSKLKELC